MASVKLAAQLRLIAYAMLLAGLSEWLYQLTQARR